ncbi:MAG: c-type cytochrome [bacterium]|nr:c-type cytochrome [bacterium]
MIKDYRLLALFLVIACGLLAASIHQAMQADWQSYQKDYYKQLSVEDYQIEVVQQNVTTPKGVLIDRCATCHIGANNEDAADFDQPLKAHPPIAPGMATNLHDLSKWGCTVCHDGNGRGLDETDAHGHLAHWTMPLLTGHMVQANCTKCHMTTDRDLKGADYLNRGRRLFIERTCWACHTIEGVSSGTQGPNLTDAGEKFGIGYLRKSILLPKDNIESSKMPRFDWLDGSEESERDVESLVVYLKSQRKFRLRDASQAPVELSGQVTAKRPKPATPSVALGKAVFHGRDAAGMLRGGCINCHSYDTGPAAKKNGNWSAPYEGGSICPNLTFSFAARGKEYVKDHIRQPTSHVVDSIMPRFVTDDPANSLTDTELESVALFLETLPQERPNRTPEALYATHCTSCHGDNFDGKGRINQGNMLLDPMPRNFRHQFVLSYESRLASSIMNGIAGTSMPPWKNLLTSAEVDGIVAYIKGEVTKDLEPARMAFKRPDIPLPKPGDADRMTGDPLVAGDAEAGRVTYARVCTGCHGKLANGKGPDAYFLEHPLPRNLINSEFMNAETMTKERLYQSILLGVPGTPMPAHDRVISDQRILDTVAYLRDLNSEEGGE